MIEDLPSLNEERAWHGCGTYVDSVDRVSYRFIKLYKMELVHSKGGKCFKYIWEKLHDLLNLVLTEAS